MPRLRELVDFLVQDRDEEASIFPDSGVRLLNKRAEQRHHRPKTEGATVVCLNTIVVGDLRSWDSPQHEVH